MKFDVAVVGGGPAGLSACVFTTRAGLKTICFEKLAVGGQAALSYDISNYPAFNSISGFDLTQKMFEQAKANGTKFVFCNVESVEKSKSVFKIITNKATYEAKKIIIACGVVSRKLGLGEEKYIGRGISYCASCDGNFFKDKTVAIVGGGDSAFEYVEYLSRIASKVYLLNRSDNFRAHSSRVQKAKKLKNVEILKNTIVKKLHGEKTLSAIDIEENEIEKKLNIDGLFVAIGHVPNLDFLNFEINLDKNGYILVDNFMQTSEKNVFACGDIISKHFKQVITACADGAIAGNSCIGGITNDK
ncbi:MAG: FAD-dependent oxidoreductase [Clostridia bacterium]|nr:FAD-dependent oxidoreductase [Clostridia bacterium]